MLIHFYHPILSTIHSCAYILLEIIVLTLQCKVTIDKLWNHKTQVNKTKSLFLNDKGINKPIKIALCRSFNRNKAVFPQ